MDQSLTGKAALVTGSTSGIGLGIAEALAAAGASVMLNGLGEPDQIERTRATLAKRHGAVEFCAADLTSPEETERLVKTTEKRFGRLDVLVNNAGIQHTALIEDFPRERWDAILAINLTAAFHAVRYALPGMKTRGWGRIINTASVHGLVASVEKSAYVAAKHGLVGLTKVVALETAGMGITANAICPGWTRTALIEQQIADRAAKLGLDEAEAATHLVEQKQPSKEFVDIEQLAALVLFLTSDAATQITGAALPVDGGWTAQ